MDDPDLYRRAAKRRAWIRGLVIVPVSLVVLAAAVALLIVAWLPSTM